MITSDNSGGRIIELEDPTSWPADLISYLEKHHTFLLAWETQSAGILPSHLVGGADYDEIIYGLCDILDRYFLVGWH